MPYERSYDIGSGPFRPNKDRGLWSSSSDFLTACIFNAFRMDLIYGVEVVFVIARGGILIFFAAILNVFLYAIPIVFIQTFLGQFSSTGFISVFRISPLFKGMGYIGLAINLWFLVFYSIFAAIPMLLFFYSLQPTLPWSFTLFVRILCGLLLWLEALSKRAEFDQKFLLSETILSSYIALALTHCAMNYTGITEDVNLAIRIPSADYFKKEFRNSMFSFSLFGCVLLVWIGVAFTLYNTTERIGQIFRYSLITVTTMLSIVFLRMLILPHVWQDLSEKISNSIAADLKWEMLAFITPMLSFASFGPGWGTILSLASYNKFNTNITKSSCLICLSQMAITIMMGLLCMFTESHLTQNNSQIMAPRYYLQWTSFLTIPSSLAAMEFPHFWTWMFLAVVIIGGINLVVVQLFSVLTAVFDEFENLRPHRKEVIFGTSAAMALISAFFCTEHGIDLIEMLIDMNIVSQGLMNLILLIVVLWIYGRERFQRDVEFMTNQIFATWKVNSVRFVTPIFLILSLVTGSLIVLYTNLHIPNLSIIIGVLVFLAWLALPGYVIFRLMQTNGTIGQRFQRCTRPIDWYPVDAEDRHRYEEAFDNPEASNPLTSII